jgi:molybdopterin converting factor small subunit
LDISYNSYILQKITDCHRESLPIEKKISLENLIGMLSIKYGAKFKNSLLDEENKKLKMLVLVNGGGITDIDYRITDKDIVNILSFVAGG